LSLSRAAEAVKEFKEKQKVFQLLHLPARYRAWTLGDFSEELQAKARTLLAGHESNMFLTGAVGSRKTSFAIAILKAHWERGETGIFVPAYDAARKLRDLNNIEETVSRWRKTDLLILDDIGANRNTPHVIEQLLFLIQHRYDWQKATIITSNLNLKGFARHIDDPNNPRATSRIEQGIMLDMGEKNWRQAGE